MADWIRFVLAASVVFAVVAGGGSLFVPPDVYSTAPITIAALVICWPVAYWLVYYRKGATGR